MRLPPARATYTVCAVTALAWAVTASAGLDAAVAELAGFIPAKLGGAMSVPGAVPVVLTPMSATLVHATILHLGFNLLMLGFCGRFVEAAIGPGGFLVLYVVGAYAAAAGQFAIDPTSSAPMIGASGAASAVVGAYALLFGRRALSSRSPRRALVLHVLWLAAAWVGLQALIGIASGGLPGLPPGSTIAIGAHVGGFLAGLILARPLLLFRYRRA